MMSPSKPSSITAFCRLHTAFCTAFCVGVIFLLGLGLRLYCLDCYSLWGDEISSLEGAHLGLQGIFTQRFGWIGNQTHLHYLIIWLTDQLSDPATSAVLVRLPSALMGALAVLVVYELGKAMFGRAQGLLAALMMALSAVHLNYSQEARPYAILATLTALAVYCLVRAEQSGSPRWWAAFAAAQALNVLHSFFAMTLVLPALAPYLAWLLWKLWRRKEKTLPYALVSLFAVALVCALMLVDMAHAPRLSPDLSRFPLTATVTSVIEMSSWLTQFGIDGQVERIFQLGLLLLAILGVYAAARGKAYTRKYAFLCGLLVAVPPIMLAVLGTSYEVFQRYAIFSMPFYFLLVSNGLAFLRAAAYKVRLGRAVQTTLRGAAVALSALSILPFVTGALNYFSPEKHYSLSYRPDFRGVASYLAQHARPEDVIIFADDPPLGFNVTHYYWRGSAPAHAYDARDPRLFTQPLDGDIYWVVGSDDSQVTGRLGDPSQGWAGVWQLEGVVILREVPPVGGIIESFERMVGKLEAIHPSYQQFVMLRGCVQQARGEIARAVATYKEAGAYFTLGGEYLRTSRGFLSIGEPAKAWQEALLAKAMQPYLPEVHGWLAQRLLADGYAAESRVEAEIAEMLRR